MGNRVVQKRRMQRYFIEAAKKIIDEKGAAAVSARNVAQTAGYSYGTIYNYFADLNHLMWYVCLEYREEIIDRLECYFAANRDKISSLELLKGSYHVYIGYIWKNLLFTS